MTHPIRILSIVLAILLVAFIGWASMRGDFGAEFGAISNMPWGQVSLADLYLGFCVYGFVVWNIETSLKTKLLWFLPILIIGNAWSLLWLAVRWDVIQQRFKP